MAAFGSFWFGGRLSGYEILCIKSFLDRGHEFNLFTYGRDTNAPEGCKICDAGEIFDKEMVFYYSDDKVSSKISAFSNMFRYNMIYETGLCWVDTDVICLTADIELTDFVFARQHEEFFNGAILKFPCGHEAMQLASEYCWEVRGTAQWGDLGPRLVTKIVEEYGLEDKAWPTQKIYPIHWREGERLLNPQEVSTVTSRVFGATFLHLWNEILSRLGIDKNKAPPIGSYLEKTVQQHGVEECFGSLSEIVMNYVSCLSDPK